MEKKLVIWFLGGSSVGKTTQAQNIHNYLSTFAPGEREIVKWKAVDDRHEQKKLCYTLMNGLSANLGEFGETACGGTDTLGSKFQIQHSFDAALFRRQVVIIEGIMATAQWLHFLKRKHVVLWTVLLDVSEEVNFSRLRSRRGAKLGIDPSQVEIALKTKENLAGKLRGFRSMYAKVAPESDFSTSIDTTDLNALRVKQLLIDDLEAILAQSF